jgi:hypothetical protein
MDVSESQTSALVIETSACDAYFRQLTRTDIVSESLS